MTAKALSWTPHWSGDIYCSPACGRGCTREEHRRAVRGADILVAAMLPDGKGWEPRVWENLGWHSQAECGGIRVMASGEGYRAYFNNNSANGEAPYSAVIALYAKLMGQKADLDKQIMDVVKATGITPWYL